MEEQSEITPEQQAEQQRKDEAEVLASAAEERRVAKEKMLKRNAARIADLKAKGLLQEGETLEEFDTRMAREKG